MRFRIIAIILSVIVLDACSALRGVEYFLSGNYSPTSVLLPDGGSFDIVANGLEYRGITIVSRLTEEGLTIQVQNGTTFSLKVLWDDAAFIDAKGLSHRLIHVGTKFIDKEKAQVPSVVAPFSYLTDTLYPEDYINLETGAWGSKDWSTKPLYPSNGMYHNRKDLDEALSGRGPIKFLLPIESEGMKYEYLFTFTSNDTIQERPYNHTWYLVGAGVLAAGLITAGILSNDNLDAQ